jgi:hypothetical protein
MVYIQITARQLKEGQWDIWKAKPFYSLKILSRVFPAYWRLRKLNILENLSSLKNDSLCLVHSGRKHHSNGAVDKVDSL